MVGDVWCLEEVAGEGGRILNGLNQLVCFPTTHFPRIQNKVKTRVRTLTINVNSENNSVEEHRQCHKKAHD